MIQLCVKQQSIIIVLDMAEIIQTNMFVLTLIQDNMITLMDASVKPVNAVRVPSVVNTTPDSNVPRQSSARTNGSVANVVSAMTTMCLDDILSPQKQSSTTTPTKKSEFKEDKDLTIATPKKQSSNASIAGDTAW